MLCLFSLFVSRSLRSVRLRWLCGVRSMDRNSTLPVSADPLYHYILVRRDLPYGVQIAQTIHAAGETGPAVKGTHAVALHVKDECQLIEFGRRLTEAGFEPYIVFEPDAPWNGAAMAIGLSPQIRTSKLRQVLGNLPLVK